MNAAVRGNAHLQLAHWLSSSDFSVRDEKVTRMKKSQSSVFIMDLHLLKPDHAAPTSNSSAFPYERDSTRPTNQLPSPLPTTKPPQSEHFQCNVLHRTVFHADDTRFTDKPFPTSSSNFPLSQSQTNFAPTLGQHVLESQYIV